MENGLVSPHGGELKPLLLEDEARKDELKRAAGLAQVRMTSRETSDLIMLAVGAFSPLPGFMGHDDYLSVVREMRTRSGLVWPIPITLSVSSDLAGSLKTGDRVALLDDESGEIMGTMTVEDKYRYDKREEAKKVFGTEDEAHPGVAKVYAQKEFNIAGPVKALSEGPYPELYGRHYGRPSDTRALFQKRGWRTVAGFQTRNPIHRSHEYCTKIALEVSDGLLIHPLVGKLKPGDIPADVRMKCYLELLEHYYPEDRVVLKVYPMEMRYGGPREAVLHAVFRQNYGCSHLIIGRDHAGVGSYYGPFDAQKIFDDFDAKDLAIKPLKIDWTFWCHKCDGMASMKTCPHEKTDRVLISGTLLREMLESGEQPPKEFSRPEVISILMDHYRSKEKAKKDPPVSSKKATNITWHQGAIDQQDRERLLKQRGVVIWFTGLSGSGKSTLAHALEERLFREGHLSYVLDGDNIRHGLNSNLGFSPSDREENIRRIGEVAKLFATSGAITMTAFISPYRADRDRARALLEPGSFFEIYVEVPLDVAEERDPKGLYKKARKGEIKEFTGISAPYEEPLKPELTLNTGQLNLEQSVERVYRLLVDKGVLLSE